jgi:quercetin dioxygenase-like cupin family protein
MLMNPVSTDAAATVESVPARSFLSSLVRIKASGADTAGSFSMIEIKALPGWETPWHVHDTHDEYFYILEGSVLARVGEAVVTLNAGDFAFGPRCVPHGYRVIGDKPARLLMMTGDRDFAEFVREASQPAADETLPQPFDGDFGPIDAASARHGITVLGAFSDVQPA